MENPYIIGNNDGTPSEGENQMPDGWDVKEAEFLLDYLVSRGYCAGKIVSILDCAQRRMGHRKLQPRLIPAITDIDNIPTANLIGYHWIERQQQPPSTI